MSALREEIAGCRALVEAASASSVAIPVSPSHSPTRQASLLPLADSSSRAQPTVSSTSSPKQPTSSSPAPITPTDPRALKDLQAKVRQLQQTLAAVDGQRKAAETKLRRLTQEQDSSMAREPAGALARAEDRARDSERRVRELNEKAEASEARVRELVAENALLKKQAALRREDPTKPIRPSPLSQPPAIPRLLTGDNVDG